MTKISKIEVRRFKQIKSFELELADATVLIGANNSGKSSVLQALHFAVSIAQTAKLLGEGVRWGANKFELSLNPSQVLYSPIADILSLAHGGKLVETPAQQIEIDIFLSDRTACRVAVRRGRNRNIAVSLHGRAVGERLMNMDRPFTVYAPGLAGIAKEERYMSPGAVRRIVARGDANLVLRNVLHMIAEAQASARAAYQVELAKETDNALARIIKLRHWRGPLDEFHADMDVLFPGIKIEVSFNRESDEFIEVFFQRPGKPHLPIDAAGTSILQASQILAYISLFRPEVLILDEPDSHLHPNNQRALCELVKSLAEKRGFRALFSTHSRHVLDVLRDSAKVVWMNGGEKVEYDAVSTPSMLMELGALDTVDYFANKHFTCLFATEDSKKESIDALSVLLTSNGFSMREVEIRPYSGCSKIDSARVLRQFLADKAPNVKFVIHRDWDYMEQQASEKFVSELELIDAIPFLTPLSDVEGYFINADHISAINPDISLERARELVDLATSNTREKSIAALINIRTESALRRRNSGEPAHDPGKLAAQAYADYDAAPQQWRRGKIVLNELKSLLHRESKGKYSLLKSSEHLACPRLQQIKSKLWPAQEARPAVA
jgi:predicted ATPase